MATSTPSFTVGIEEEYLLVHRDTLDLAAAPESLMEDCGKKLGKKFSPEFMQCQVEVGTGVCTTIAEAKEDLAHLRRTVADIAATYDLAPVAVSTHPFGKWQQQHFTDKQRYRDLERDLAGVARRMLISGMHVHVGIDDDDLRMDLMGQFSYFLPHLLALSTSSPFWEGDDTGLGSYRLTVFDNLPRTGIPPQFNSFAEYQRSIQTIIGTGIIEDGTKIWWDLRPSARFPTLESRICDVSPRLNDTVALAALTQSLFRMLYVLRTENKRWRAFDRFLIEENRWRALRYGIAEGLIDFGTGELVPFATLLDELIEMLSPHAAKLGCLEELLSLTDILARGTSADRQTDTFDAAINSGASRDAALKEVVRGLVEEFTQDL